MASRYEVEVTVSSARDLKNVNWRHGPLTPYAVVWLDPNNKISTKVDEYGDTSPSWDQTLVIPVPGRIDQDTTLYIDVVHYGQESDTKPLIGSAKLKLTDVIDDVGYGESTRRTLQVKRPSGRPHGKIDVKVAVNDPRYRAQDARYQPAYGVPPPAASSRDPYADPYGAPPSGYASAPYGQPPTYGQPSYGQVPQYGQPGYGQAPQYGQPGYGQAAQYGQADYGQAEQKKSKFGGMGTGLAVGAVAGVLGTLAVTEGVDALEDHITDEVAEKVEDDEYDDDEPEDF
ncbi:C2 domain-containing protein [Cephalotus follicularis]|uniref:C2 domain-containing protein n=1 Tax=Cephalotus follicularis TaxID=3775 RepID=A0A1Q3C7V5_CEPFO|nr:C2 domain-containing protein [Cephalotus follicularis]